MRRLVARERRTARDRQAVNINQDQASVGVAHVPICALRGIGERCLCKLRIFREHPRRFGTFYDKGLEGASHHAVIPNVNTIDKLREVWPRLSSDERKLFDVIARAYLAALMPDFRYRQTTATLDVRGFEFRASGRQPIDLGWRTAFPDWQPADEKGEEAQLLPPLRNGETAQLHNPKIENKETRPPPRYNEGTLIEAMQNAWRFVDDEVLRDRLKEAKGIGTPATERRSSAG